MSLVLALDPNVLWAAADRGADSFWVIQYLARHPEEYRLGTDPDLHVWDALADCYARSRGNRRLTAFVKLFFGRGRNKRIAIVDEARLTPDEQQWLCDNSCGEPVEPDLVAVAKSSLGDGMVVLGGGCTYSSSNLAKRGTDNPTIVNRLHREFPHLRVWPVDRFWEKIAQVPRALYPGTEKQLAAYMMHESEFEEYKQPGKKDPKTGEAVPITTLTDSIIKESFSEVNSFINKAGGKVFVGITRERELLGIEPPLDSSGKPDDDRLVRDWFEPELKWCTPSVNCYLAISVIPLESGLRVVMLDVERGLEGVQYAYDDAHYTLVYTRDGPCKKLVKRLPSKRKQQAATAKSRTPHSS